MVRCGFLDTPPISCLHLSGVHEYGVTHCRLASILIQSRYCHSCTPSVIVVVVILFPAPLSSFLLRSPPRKQHLNFETRNKYHFQLGTRNSLPKLETSCSSLGFASICRPVGGVLHSSKREIRMANGWLVNTGNRILPSREGIAHRKQVTANLEILVHRPNMIPIFTAN